MTVKVEGDYYISALPVEVIAPLLNPQILKADPGLNGILTLKDHIAWMNGIQFFLKEDVCLVHGHTIYIDSAWSLTSICQKQFWPGIDLNHYGDGAVKGIISIDISDWKTPGPLYGKPACECTKEEIKEEIWSQIKKGQNHDDEQLLKDNMIHSWFLDPDIVFPNPHPTINLEPLLINKADSWHLRPKAYTMIPNFFLASDYIQTNTDLATMEGANEAARRAVNCIINVSGSNARHCKIWDLHEPNIFALMRYKDKQRFKKGLPWNWKQPWWLKCLQYIRVTFFNITGK
jgi:15-cis-phytoene desaturase